MVEEKVEDAVWILCCSFDSLLARELKSWENRKWKTVVEKNGREAIDKVWYLSSSVAIYRIVLEIYLPVASLPVEILLVDLQDFIFVLSFFTLAYLKSRSLDLDHMAC